MVTVKIYGGLGNQLFQYAAGYALAQRLNVPLALDKSFYEKDKFRDFLLAELKAPWESYDPSKHGMPYESGIHGLWDRLLAKAKGFPTLPKVREKFFHFNKPYDKVEQASYLDGYWQSERYFKDYKQSLKKVLQFKDHLKFSQHPLSQEIKEQNSIAIHIRRSDYTHKINQKLFYTCSEDYYKKALSHLEPYLQEAVFYLFSDDPEWVKDHFAWLKPRFIVQGNNTLQDFFLMQQAKHHIIANSSYSWWAAWLCENPQQKVVAPLLWFKDKNKNTKDLIPQNWIRL